ncbi:hypothetical protein DPMN_001142 [Dreissena polymorpha]|uniref:Kinesin motor domain-containing protein n=1 Tax=Dreissena polymorpha TaxID=45954 RepID=A0A9D4MJQ6_DREPO|nr:hypothetical protein DPMN_001142 [Dreissena polymorpha]
MRLGLERSKSANQNKRFMKRGHFENIRCRKFATKYLHENENRAKCCLIEMPLPSNRKRAHEPDIEAGGGDAPSSNVKVVVRIRPPNVKEVEGNFREVVQAVDENVLVFDPKENSCNDYRNGTGRKRPRDISKRANRDLKFAFDRVFAPNATNMDIYNETTNCVLTGILNGYNCSVFAYGATGAGKTHTMLGSKEHPGVMYHTMMDLYARIEQMKDTKTCDVAVSYLEVYNETIRDLLVPGGNLPIREDPGHGVVIHGLSLHKPKSAEDLLSMLQYGNQHRTQHPTDANAESSRSHAVFQVFVRQKDRTANISTEVRVAKLCLVDLAGSERATVTKNMGSRMREGANINRSLLALGNVINALAENKSKGYVPYRDSKLTRLLKDSLGGNCQTVMIAAVSPSAMSFEDTYNTLRYADRAKHIKAELKKNVLNVDFHMAQYGKIVQELRKEIKELKGKLQSYEGGSQVSSKMAAPPPVNMFSCSKYEGEICSLYANHQAVFMDQLQGEITLRSLQWKIYRRSRCLKRLATLDEAANVESVKVVDSLISGLGQKAACMEVSSNTSRGKVANSFKHLADMEQKMQAHAMKENNNRVPEALPLRCQFERLRCELDISRQQLAFTQQAVRCQERELVHNERLLHQLLKLVKHQHYILKGHKILTSDLVSMYEGVNRWAAGQEVSWEDSEQGGEDSYVRGYTLEQMLDLPVLGLKHESADTQDMPILDKPVAEENKVFRFTATSVNTAPQSFPQRVDECSPPKAKRMMLAPSCSQPAAMRVKGHRGVTTPNQSRSNVRSKSQSEGSSQRHRLPSNLASGGGETIPEADSDNLDNTFTIEPTVNPEVLPHVDSTCHTSVNKSNLMNEHGETVADVYNPDPEPALNYSNCVDESRTGLSNNLGENDSGTSTIVDQSANSVTSLASVSTLVDGPQNSSQNLSGLDEAQNCRTSLEPPRAKEVAKPPRASINSNTVVKSTRQSSEKPVSCKALRSITFEDSGSISSSKGEQQTDVSQSKTPDRKPLRQVGSGNTPNSQQRRSSFSKDSNQKRLSAGRSTPSRLSDKENMENKLDDLSRYGMPSLVAGSLLNTGRTIKTEQTSGSTPNYMQATKSHMNRKIVHLNKNTSLNSSDDSTGLSSTAGSTMAKSAFISKNARPLGAHMRSKSACNLATRAAWQF